MSRVSKEQASRNRQAVVAAASRLIRQKGLDGVGVRELMASAGLTQGAFAKQFQTKETLAAEACAFAFEGAEKVLGALSDRGAPQLAKHYLSPEALERNCPMATLAMDTARSAKGSPLREAYCEGLGRLGELIAGSPPAPARLTLLAAMVGASILRRAMDDNVLADQIETAVLEFSQTID